MNIDVGLFYPALPADGRWESLMTKDGHFKLRLKRNPLDGVDPYKLGLAKQLTEAEAAQAFELPYGDSVPAEVRTPTHKRALRHKHITKE